MGSHCIREKSKNDGGEHSTTIYLQRQVKLDIHWSTDRPSVNSPGAFHINFYDSITHKKKSPQDPIPISKKEWLTATHILSNPEIYSLHDKLWEMDLYWWIFKVVYPS